MEAIIKYSLDSYQETIDLTEHGHDEDVKWSDLSEEEQCEIRDSLVEQMWIQCHGENCDSY